MDSCTNHATANTGTNGYVQIPTQQGTCPNCGRCPHCGSQPVQAPLPYYYPPYQQPYYYPVVYC